MAKERSTRKKKDSSTQAAAAAAAAPGVGTAELSATPATPATSAAPPLPPTAPGPGPGPGPYNGSENPWTRWGPPRPDSYFGAGPYNSYDWPHSWSHGDFGAFPPPRGGFPPHYMQQMQPSPAAPPAAPPVAPPPAAGNSPNSSNPDSQSEGSDFSDAAATDDPISKRKRKSSEAAAHKPGSKPDASKGDARNGAKGKSSAAAAEENSAKNKRYGIEEVKDLVRFRTDLQAKFETMSTHLELWTSIGERMSDRGHPKRQWESYRDKWDIELRRYQKELKVLQAGMVENKDGENPNPNTGSNPSSNPPEQQLVFSDELLQEIHNRLNSRPKVALRSRFQSGAGGARGCLGEESAREVAGKRMKKSANNQLLVDSIVDKVVEKVGSFDDTLMAQGFKEVLDAVTGVLLADANLSAGAAAGCELVIDDKVFGWLKSVGKEQFAGQFAEAQIDWNTLTMLDRDDLAEMKIPIGPRKYLLQELGKLRSAAAAAAAQAQELLNLHIQSQPEPETETEAV